MNTSIHTRKHAQMRYNIISNFRENQSQKTYNKCVDVFVGFAEDHDKRQNQFYFTPFLSSDRWLACGGLVPW